MLKVNRFGGRSKIFHVSSHIFLYFLGKATNEHFFHAGRSSFLRRILRNGTPLDKYGRTVCAS